METEYVGGDKHVGEVEEEGLDGFRCTSRRGT